MAALAGSGLVRGEHALAVGDAEEEPEPGEVVAQRAGAVGLAADEPGQGRDEGGAVGFQPVAEELEQLGEFASDTSTGLAGITRSPASPVSRGAGPAGGGTG